MPVLQQPEAYLGGVAGLIDASGRITSSKTVEFLKRFVGAFDQWVRRLREGSKQWSEKNLRETEMESLTVRGNANFTSANRVPH